jgi:hypothetical protein
MAPVAAAVLPHPPLLVPELAGDAAPELEPLRAACRQALAAVIATADLTIVVGGGPIWGVPEPLAVGSFRRYGAEVEAALPTLAGLDLPGLPSPARLTDLPLSLAIAAHLLADLIPPTRLFAATVPPSLGPGAAAAIGRTLAAAAQAWVASGSESVAATTVRATTAARWGTAGSSPTPAGGRAAPTPVKGRTAAGGRAAPTPVKGRTAAGGRAAPTPVKGRTAATRAAATAGPGARPAAIAGLGAAAADPGPSPSASAGGPRPGGVGLVVMGDLSACRTQGAPGSFRPEAAGFDASVAEAFRTAEPTRLLDLDPSLAADLLVAGRVPLQVLAGAFQDTPTPTTPARVPEEGGSAVPARDAAEGPPILRGQILYDQAPYGVGYLVAVLTTP